ncbi:ROK family protein [Novipirellula aureliae]|nr:ROK family protein [Novipirellula aureliae]
MFKSELSANDLGQNVSDRNALYLGIDVGGTEVKLGLIDSDGEILALKQTATSDLVSPENVLAFAIDFARYHCEKNGWQSISAVGLAVPGVLDTRKSIIREVVNLDGWLGVPLKDMLSQRISCPATVVNDANAAAFAEHGVRKLNDRSLAMLTLGTGVGCGLVVDGKPCGGDFGCAGELGHVAIDFSDSALPCGCGSCGHLESYAGAGGVVGRMRVACLAANQQIDSALTPRGIAERAESGDKIAIHIVIETGMYIGRAIGMVGQVINPAVVLLGGAMTFGGEASKVGQLFLQAVRESVQQTTLVQVSGNMQIEFARLGNRAGVIGAAMVARHHLDLSPERTYHTFS